VKWARKSVAKPTNYSEWTGGVQFAELGSEKSTTGAWGIPWSFRGNFWWAIGRGEQGFQ
jgi:hypothetical protein